MRHGQTLPVGDNHHLWAQLIIARIDSTMRAIGITETGLCDAHDSDDEDVGGNAVQHAFADRSESHPKTGIKVASGENDFHLLGFPEDLGMG